MPASTPSIARGEPSSRETIVHPGVSSVFLPLSTGFFDTGVGAKISPASYEHIAGALGQPASRVLFVSDVTRELDAARAAGMQVLLSIRPGNPVQADAAAFESIRSFDEIPATG